MKRRQATAHQIPLLWRASGTWRTEAGEWKTESVETKIDKSKAIEDIEWHYDVSHIYLPENSMEISGFTFHAENTRVDERIKEEAKKNTEFGNEWNIRIYGETRNQNKRVVLLISTALTFTTSGATFAWRTRWTSKRMVCEQCVEWKEVTRFDQMCSTHINMFIRNVNKMGTMAAPL